MTGGSAYWVVSGGHAIPTMGPRICQRGRSDTVFLARKPPMWTSLLGREQRSLADQGVVGAAEIANGAMRRGRRSLATSTKYAQTNPQINGECFHPSKISFHPSFRWRELHVHGTAWDGGRAYGPLMHRGKEQTNRKYYIQHAN